MYLFFDTETTGLPKDWKAPVTNLENWPRLVQLAYLLYSDEGLLVSKSDFIIRPDGFSIPDEATKIHGISTDKANQEGRHLADVLQTFTEYLNQANCIVAHNIRFDEKIVGAEFLRMGLKDPLLSKKKICTMLRSTDFCAIKGKYGYKWPSLTELHQKLFQTKIEEAHNAAIDICATANCFWELKRLKVL